MLLKEIWSILPICHFMFFDRYWSHIQDLQDFNRRIVGVFRRPSFRKFVKILEFHNSEIYKNSTSPKWFCIFLILLRYPGVPKNRNNCFGGRGHVRKSLNHRNEEFRSLPRANRIVIRPNWTGIILRSFYTYDFHKITIKMAQQMPQHAFANVLWFFYDFPGGQHKFQDILFENLLALTSELSLRALLAY